MDKELGIPSIAKHCLKYNWENDKAFQLAVIAIRDMRNNDLEKISHHFAIPVKDLEKALRSKDQWISY